MFKETRAPMDHKAPHKQPRVLSSQDGEPARTAGRAPTSTRKHRISAVKVWARPVKSLERGIGGGFGNRGGSGG